MSYYLAVEVVDEVRLPAAVVEELGRGWGEDSIGSCFDIGSSSSSMSLRFIRWLTDTYCP